ncbi:MAG: 5'(3')-deoxyribonucleotidase [Ferruginibacter sp.]
MKKISVDMDGVIANVYNQFMSMHKEEFGTEISPQDLEGKFETEVFPEALKYVNSKGFFRNAPLIEGCQNVLERLNDRYKVFIVSAAMEFPNSLAEKHDWLREHFPFILWQQIVFCGSKEIINADIMIDDHFKNLNSFSGDTTLLFTQPHNILTDPGKHTRVNTWEEIANILLT